MIARVLGRAGQGRKAGRVDDLICHQDVLESLVGQQSRPHRAVAQVTPTQLPASIWRRSSLVHLCALKCGRSFALRPGEKFGSPRDVAVGRGKIDDQARRGEPGQEFRRKNCGQGTVLPKGQAARITVGGAIPIVGAADLTVSIFDSNLTSYVGNSLEDAGQPPFRTVPRPLVGAEREGHPPWRMAHRCPSPPAGRISIGRSRRWAGAAELWILFFDAPGLRPPEKDIGEVLAAVRRRPAAELAEGLLVDPAAQPGNRRSALFARRFRRPRHWPHCRGASANGWASWGSIPTCPSGRWRGRWPA